MSVPIASGLDRLVAGGFADIAGRRVGLLCHAASVDRSYRHAADLLHAAPGVDLRCLFGPEHGVRGAAQDMVGVDDERDPVLGVPVVSLYGAGVHSLRPAAAALADIDVLVVDLRDVGSRYYTYVWTAVMAMEAVADAGGDVSVLVLDRPNPLGGLRVEGPTILPGFASLVGYHPVCTRHALTLGELCLLSARERRIDVDLRVVPCAGWQGEVLLDEPRQAWVMPSPNMPTPRTALVYPGMCLLEGTNLSEGRGTTRPFELLGAPYVDGRALAARLADDALPGVVFRPVGLQPTFQKHAGLACGGVQLHVTDPARFAPLRTGVAVLRACLDLWPGAFAWRREAYEFVGDVPAIDLLAGGPWLREGLEAGASTAALCAPWAEDERAHGDRVADLLLAPRHLTGSTAP